MQALKKRAVLAIAIFFALLCFFLYFLYSLMRNNKKLEHQEGDALIEIELGQ